MTDKFTEGSTEEQRVTEAKADYSSIYVAPDPRPYYATLAQVDYSIPGEAAPLFDLALRASRNAGQERPVLDVGCSYGINAALLRTNRTYPEVVAHYAALGDADSDAVTAVDLAVLTKHPQGPARVIRGLDAAVPAIDYAVRAGLLDAGWAEDLEHNEPSAELAKGISDTEMIISTGAIGYVGAATYRRLLACLEYPERTWLVSVVLRAFSFEPIAEACASYGLVSEPIPVPPLRQRRFADAAERDAALHDVTARGLDPTGLEGDGAYYAHAWLTRPADDVAAQPVDTLFAR